MSESIHKGHRQRMKERFLQEGLDHFTDIQVLELLLFYCVPRQDTNPLAHRLLQHFGSFAQVLDAPVEELAKVPGIGESAATFLHLIPEASRYYQVDQASHVVILPTLEKCARYMVPFFYGRRVETVFLLCLDAKCKVICCKEVGEGCVNSASISTRKIVETALGVNATSVVLAHNHPSGVAIPSGEDIQTTQRIAAALHCVDIQLVDHIVVADDDYISMAQSGGRFREALMV